MTTAGIDFGTTNSVLSIWTPSGVEVIDIDTPPLEWEQMGFAKVMPTIIAADPSGNTEYGWKAKQGTNQVLEAVKRLLPTVETVMVGDQPVLVEQLVATFFAHIKKCALSKGVEIDRVVHDLRILGMLGDQLAAGARGCAAVHGAGHGALRRWQRPICHRHARCD